MNVILLLLILTRMTGSLWRSAAVAAIFALHPLQVESVAWIAERKTLLSTLFFLLTIIAYLRFIGRRSAWGYAAVMLMYACSLASKPMLVTLPFLLLLLDIWPLRRINLGTLDQWSITDNRGMLLIKEKLPLLAHAISSCVITLVVQRDGGAIKSLGSGYVAENTAHALVNYVRYVLILLWPSDLAVIYPYVRALPLWQLVAAAALLILVTVLAVRSFPKRPYWAFGWFWFMITLIPMVGFIRIGAHSIADRYTYLPVIGLSVVVIWTAADFLATIRHGKLMTVAGCIILCSALSVGTAHQVAYWKDSITLFEHALAVTKDNWLAHNNLASELVQRGEIAQAYTHAQESIRIIPKAFWLTIFLERSTPTDETTPGQSVPFRPPWR